MSYDCSSSKLFVRKKRERSQEEQIRCFFPIHFFVHNDGSCWCSCVAFCFFCWLWLNLTSFPYSRTHFLCLARILSLLLFLALIFFRVHKSKVKLTAASSPSRSRASCAVCSTRQIKSLSISPFTQTEPLTIFIIFYMQIYTKISASYSLLATVLLDLHTTLRLSDNEHLNDVELCMPA